MAKASFTDLIDSVFVAELPITYYPPDIREIRGEIALCEEALAHPPPEITTKKERDAHTKELTEEKNRLEIRLAALEAQTKVPAVALLFTKLTKSEHERVEMLSRDAMTATIEVEKAHRDAEIRHLRLLLDPNGILSDDVLSGPAADDGADMALARETAREMIIAQILAAEGQSESWASAILDDDPDMALTAAELDSLEIDERLPPDQQAAHTLDYDSRQAEVKAEKRQRLQVSRTAQREKRKKALEGKEIDPLLEILANYKALSKAHEAASAAYDDGLLFYATKNPSAPIYTLLSGRQQLDGYERYFESVEHLAYLRERVSDLYQFLAIHYQELQQIRGREDVDRVARSSLFLFDL